MRYQQNKIKFFTARELNQIFTVLEQKIKHAKTPYQKQLAIRNSAMIRVMYYCALRVSEVVNLKVSDYDYYQNQIYCTRGKNGNSNTLFLVDADVTFALRRHLEINQPKTYLFEKLKHGQDGTSMSRKTFDRIVRDICWDTNIMDTSKFHCHTFRHTMAIRLLEDGCSIYDVQFWLGHKDISNTQIYLAFTKQQQLRLYKLLKKSKGAYHSQKTTLIQIY